MTKLKMTTLAAAVLGMGVVSTMTFAGSEVIDADFSRYDPDKASGDKVSTVRNNCGGGVNGFDGASATLELKQKGADSNVEIEVSSAVPNTLFTVWVRVKGKNGLDPLGSPLTGGGATPLAPGSALDALNAISPWIDPAGAPGSANSFTTDANGDAEFEIDLDFPVVRGAYPFQMTATSRPGHEGHANVPTAIVDPREPGQGSAPFLIRVVSHCTDNSSHGLSPATREAWFQYP